MARNKMRNKKGQFMKGFGFWTGKKRDNLKNTNAVNTMFKKDQIPWNKGKSGTYEVTVAKSRFGHVPWNKGISTPETGLGKENHPMWKGGKPKCLDCGKELAKYGTNGQTLCVECHKQTPSYCRQMVTMEKGGVAHELQSV